MLKFFQAANLKVATLEQGAPWDFSPDPEKLDKWRGMDKEIRRKHMTVEKTEWNVYSAVGGLAPNLRVSAENPPAVMRGIVADYDVPQSVDSVVELLNHMKGEYVPNFIEVTLSGHVRLVWVFEKEVLTPDARFCTDALNAFIDKFKINNLLPGFDEASRRPAEMWTNGGEWHSVHDNPLPWKTVFGVISSVAKKVSSGDPNIPLPILHDEIEKRFPGRWKGPFELNNLGVRFWDETADCPTGCQVKADGMICFTGRVPFMSWDKILGAAWCEQQRTMNLGHAAADTYFDGRSYWRQCAGLWVPVSREDILLNLKTRGISNKAERGQTAAPAERVLHFVQTANRVSGAAPLINHRPGLVTLDGSRVLNISTVRAMVPAEGTATPDDFPWTWKFLHGLFDHPELKSLDYFLAWTKRAYASALNYRIAMGQALFLCGPASNGKTLISLRYLKPLLGNKASNPYDYFVGATPFNDELFESHLLTINDEEATTRDETRQKFIARIKSFVVNPSHTYHPKYCKRLMIESTVKIFITLNDDPASVGLLPEVNANTQDKLMFFGSRDYKQEWEDKEVIEDRIEKELPFFARWLLDWQPPKEVLTQGRMGVKSFFDPRILELSQQQGPAYSLLELIKIWCQEGPFWTDEKTEWVGTASELVTQLSVLDHLHILLKDWNSYRAAKSLTTLARSNVPGVEFVERRGQRLFKIKRQQVIEGQNDKPIL